MNQVAETMPKYTVTLYGCGGGGINNVSGVAGLVGTSETGRADVQLAFIDTSRANLDRVGKLGSLYHITDADGNPLEGAGGWRPEHAEAIQKRVPEVLQKHKPGDWAIVVSTGAGGSGSVIAPSLVEELTKRGVPTIAIIIGDTSDLIRVRATVGTIKSYDRITSQHGKPVVAAYFENSREVMQSANDACIVDLISFLLVLLSGQNQRLDRKDLINFLNFTKVTSYGPCLADLVVIPATLDEHDAKLSSDVITVASLVNGEGQLDVPGVTKMLEYQAHGVLGENVAEVIRKQAPMHFVVGVGMFKSVLSRLEGILKESRSETAARVDQGSLVKDTDKCGPGSLVFE